MATRKDGWVMGSAIAVVNVVEVNVAVYSFLVAWALYGVFAFICKGATQSKAERMGGS